MKINEGSQVPIFVQIGEELEKQIMTGILEEEQRIPSTNELALVLKINPHTVLKGMNLLVEEGLIYKKRGVGMFVTQGAREKIKDKRIAEFRENFVRPLIRESKALGITTEDLRRILLSELERSGDNE